MNLVDLVFGRKKQQVKSDGYFKTFTAYSPRFTNWDGRLYESELIRSSVDAASRHVAKLQFTLHGTANEKLRALMRVSPNPWMTWPQFLERCNNIYMVQNNLFVVPLLDEYGVVNGYFPVLPSACEIVQQNGKPYLRFAFMAGERRAIEISRVAIIAKHQLNDDFFGEKNTALSSTMRLVNMINQGIEEGVKSAASYRFMAQLSTHQFDEDIVKERKRFDRLNFSDGNGGGLLLFDGRFNNVKQIEPTSYKVDPQQMQLIQTNVYNYFGVNEDIIQNKADGDKLDAFYNGYIETFAIKLADALTKITFTNREIINNFITFTANRLQYMNVSAKVQMARELGDRGVLMIDEIRQLFNYAPLPDGAGQHAPIRGEYYMVDEGKTDNKESDDNE